MARQQLTYDELAEVWGISREAARKKVEGLHLPRTPGNDGKVRVTVDLAEIEHRPLKPRKDSARRPPGDRAEAEALRQHVETLKAELERLTTLAASNRTDFERERERAEKLAGEVADLARRLAQAVEDAAGRERNLQDKAVEAERAADGAEAEALQARAEAERAGVEAERARVEAEQARAELAAFRARSWWRRAFG